MKKKTSSKKLQFSNNTKSFFSKLTKGERPLKRNQSIFLINNKETKSTKQLIAGLQPKTNNSFLSQEFDNYYDNFLKTLHEESSTKINPIYHSPKKEKNFQTRKNTGINIHMKRSSIQYKPFILQQQKNEFNNDIHPSNMEALPEIKINALDSNISKNDNNIEQSLDILKDPLQNENLSTLRRIKIKSTFNDNDSKYTNNKGLATELLNSNRINGIPMDNNSHIEMNKNNNVVNNILKNSYVSIASPKSNLQSMKGSNILSVKHTENFTLGEQMFINKKSTKDFILSPKYGSPSNMNMKQYKKLNNTESNINLLNVNVMQVNPINSFNNAQKINICKNRNNSPLNTNRINKSKVNSRNPSPSLRYEPDYQSINSSFDKATKKNELAIIHKTNTKPSIKKMSNRNSRNNNIINNSNNNTPLLQFKQVSRNPSQRNDEQILLSSECELKEKTKCPPYQDKPIIQQLQPTDNCQTNEFSNLKRRKFFFCIPCK